MEISPPAESEFPRSGKSSRGWAMRKKARARYHYSRSVVTISSTEKIPTSRLLRTGSDLTRDEAQAACQIARCPRGWQSWQRVGCPRASGTQPGQTGAVAGVESGLPRRYPRRGSSVVEPIGGPLLSRRLCFAAVTSLADLESQVPWIDWREPIPITVPTADGAVPVLGCRICVVTDGIKADDIIAGTVGFADRGAFLTHFREAHGS